jgi:hypothetical protein
MWRVSAQRSSRGRGQSLQLLRSGTSQLRYSGCEDCGALCMIDLVRKVVSYREEVMIEGGESLSRPWRLAAVAAVVRNPWAGQGFVQNLRPGIQKVAPHLGQLIVPRLISLVGGGIEAYGKSAVVGTAGEIEHAAALIHTLLFGNELREEVQGTTFIPSTNKRSGAGSAIVIPLKHKTLEGARSHFLSMEFQIPDAPAPDEIVVALAAASGGRPHHRIGDRYEDMREFGVDQTKRIEAAGPA